MSTSIVSTDLTIRSCVPQIRRLAGGPTLELCLGLVGFTVIGQCSTKVLGSQVSRDALNNFHDSSELFISSPAGLVLTVCDFFSVY